MPAHVHAELMAQYAQDAMETDTPWKRWEFYDETEAAPDWGSLTGQPGWNTSIRYRRKPRTIKINGFDVPEPCREEPEFCAPYFTADVSIKEGFRDYTWTRDNADYMFLARGLIHLTQEAAKLHTQALLSFTQKATDA